MRLGRRTLPEPPVDPVNPESAWRWRVSPLTMGVGVCIDDRWAVRRRVLQ